jgi:cytochrome c553
MRNRMFSHHYAVLTAALLLGFIATGGVPLAFGADDTQPYWAWGFTGPAQKTPPPPAPPAKPQPAPDNKKLYTLPGSRFSFTEAQVSNVTIENRYKPVDWYPEDHPENVPDIVARGRRSAEIYPCGLCHRPNGNGRPENAAITGLTYEYFVRQLQDFKSGARQSSDPRKENVKKMIAFAKLLTDEEIHAAATYFTAIPAKSFVKVIETDTVPKTVSKNDLFLVAKGAAAGVEPIGRRIIETPVNEEETEVWKSSRAAFFAYVPTGSLKQGEALVTAGVTTGGEKVTPCIVCHGADLRGLGPVPRLAGHSPSYLARQLYDMQTGSRAGPWSVLMAEDLGYLSPDDLLVAAAYLASLGP